MIQVIGISMHYFNALEDICLVLGSQSYEELLFDILGVELAYRIVHLYPI